MTLVASRRELTAELVKHKRLVQVAQDAQEYAENIIQTVREPFLVLDTGLRVVSASRSFYKAYQVTPEETLGQLVYDLGNHQWDIPALRKLLERILPERNPFDGYEVEHNFDTIGRRTMLLNGRRIEREGNDSQLILLAIEDITDRRLVEAGRLAAEEHLRQGQKLESIGTLASGVAHEVNNPLMAMINYAELLKDGPEEEQAAQYADGIIREGNRVATIVRHLLSFARQEKETHSPAYLKDIIDASLSLVGAIMRKDQIAVELDVPDDLPQVRCRSQQIQQVVINLLTNARDALNVRYPGHDEDKILSITARPFEKDGAAWIRTTVEDHGAGIPENRLKRIFDPFFTTKPRDEGTGLGLSVSYGIVREHHGELLVESAEGSFTRFHMDLRVNNGWTLKDQQAQG